MDELIEGITTVGFPIVSFLMMFWLVTNTLSKNTDALNKLTDAVNYINRSK